MSFRFICPHCRASIDPVAMEESCSEGADLRVCPGCDSPVVLALRAGQGPRRFEPGARPAQSGRDAGNDRVAQFDPDEATA